MMVVYILVALLALMCLLMALALWVLKSIVLDLTDKIALPLYDQTSKRTVYVRPEKKVEEPLPEDVNLGTTQDEYAELDELDVDTIFKAATGQKIKEGE